jgi:hypothetical protein
MVGLGYPGGLVKWWGTHGGRRGGLQKAQMQKQLSLSELYHANISHVTTNLYRN